MEMDTPPDMTSLATRRSPRPLPAPAGRVLVVGTRGDRRRLVRCLSEGPCRGFPVVGFVDAGHPGHPSRPGLGRHRVVHPQADPVPVLGGLDRLGEWVDRCGATDLVVALTGRPARRLRPRIDLLAGPDIRVHWLVDEVLPDEIDAPPARSAPRANPPASWDRMAKRAVDFLGAAAGLLALAPLFAAVSLAIAITSGRPILYRQDRVGQGGRIFRMLKFRSMRTDAEGQSGPIWASDRDDRCTRVGGWLRRTSVDELPQLFNVLVGEMSLVGPRPERPVFVDRFRATLADYDLRHAVPGGMTGWAQVHGWRGRTSLRKRIQYDLDYIQRWSFWLDFRVLLMTVQHVAWGKTSWAKKPPGPRPGP